MRAANFAVASADSVDHVQEDLGTINTGIQNCIMHKNFWLYVNMLLFSTFVNVPSILPTAEGDLV